ncbi:MAG TPA: O-methyltransferase [Bacteroidota bacterium]|nr:O-methyltransferase [Bacteroidota bacterium]
METPIIDSQIERYLTEIIPDRDAVLSDMEEFAASREFPIVGPLVGRMLYIIAKAMNAKRILEMGSGFGYSAYWFAKAIGKDGKVICTEGSSENEKLAASYFKRGNISDRIEFHVGDALKLIDKIDGEFDIIFNDIDKSEYPKALKKAVPRLRKGGLLISDNVLWSGKILQKKPDAATAGILTFNRMIYTSKELFTTIIPLRDGVSISLKL